MKVHLRVYTYNCKVIRSKYFYNLEHLFKINVRLLGTICKQFNFMTSPLENTVNVLLLLLCYCSYCSTVPTYCSNVPTVLLFLLFLMFLLFYCSYFFYIHFGLNYFEGMKQEIFLLWLFHESIQHKVILNLVVNWQRILFVKKNFPHRIWGKLQLFA